MSEGWITLHRGWRENALFKGEFSRADAWVWLIENAAWKPVRVRIKGDGFELQRGELTFSVRFMAEAWGWSKSRVDRFITDLRDEGMIETRSKIGTVCDHKAGQGQSIITICNYNKYQDINEGNRDNSGTTSGTTAGQQRDKEEPLNKETKIYNGSHAAPKAHSQVEKPTGVSDQIWVDFIAHRKRKRADISQTVIAGFQREADKIGWTIEMALNESVVQGWQGFKASWVKDVAVSSAAPSAQLAGLLGK